MIIFSSRFQWLSFSMLKNGIIKRDAFKQGTKHVHTTQQHGTEKEGKQALAKPIALFLGRAIGFVNFFSHVVQ